MRLRTADGKVLAVASRASLPNDPGVGLPASSHESSRNCSSGAPLGPWVRVSTCCGSSTSTIQTHTCPFCPTDEVTISAAFDNFDVDGSGKIDSKELGALAEDLGFPFATKAELAAAVQALDQDHSGQIDKVRPAVRVRRVERWV